MAAGDGFTVALDKLGFVCFSFNFIFHHIASGLVLWRSRSRGAWSPDCPAFQAHSSIQPEDFLRPDETAVQFL
jgi:hypothetical protein